MAASLSRWHRVFAAALEQRAAVGFQIVLQEHLGRTASRGEAISARRAAHSYAAAGRGRLERVPVAEHGNRYRLVLVRTDADATPDLLAAALCPAGVTPVPRDARTMHTEASRRLVETVKEVAAQARHIDAGEVDPADGAALAGVLGVALGDLAKLRRGLARPTRSPRLAATPGTAAVPVRPRETG